MLVAAGAHNVAAIDSVSLDIGDLDGLRASAEDAVASGLAAVACVHPSQAEVVRQGYRPTRDKVEWPRRLVATAADASGVFTLDGRMVDPPVLRQAQCILD